MESLRPAGATALVSISNLLWSNCTAQHLHSRVYNTLIPSDFYDYAFTIVRDPIDRIQSEYRMRCREYKLGNMDVPTFQDWLDFVLWQYNHNKYMYDNHIRPQSEFISDGVEVFRYEDGLDVVVRRLEEVLCRKIELPAERINAGEEFDIIRSSREDTLIGNFYEIDFNTLGYKQPVSVVTQSLSTQ